MRCRICSGISNLLNQSRGADSRVGADDRQRVNEGDNSCTYGCIPDDIVASLRRALARQ